MLPLVNAPQSSKQQFCRIQHCDDATGITSCMCQQIHNIYPASFFVKMSHVALVARPDLHVGGVLELRLQCHYQWQ